MMFTPEQIAVREKVWHEATVDDKYHFADEDIITFSRQELRLLHETILHTGRQAAALHELVRDAGVDDIDPRLDYVMLQVTRDVWREAQRRT